MRIKPGLWKVLLKLRLTSIVNLFASREKVTRYWTDPSEENLPAEYTKGVERSKFLVELVQGLVDKDARILEVGCNVGRNLNELFKAGFENLDGIELSKNAVDQMKHFYPEMSRSATIINSPAEQALFQYEDRSIDVVFTMAVLEHIHPESEFIFDKMAKIARKFLITIENEDDYTSGRSFPRNYRKIFEKRGLAHVHEIPVIPDMPASYVARVFKVTPVRSYNLCTCGPTPS